MSLMQKAEKIKSFYPVLLTFTILNVIVFLTTISYIYEKLYNSKSLKYVFDAFPVDDLGLKRGYSREVSVDQADFLEKIVASKNGTKYYYPTCSGVNRIKTENRVYFNDLEAAKREGYELAENCEKP